MKKQPKISPEDYRKCLQGLDLTGISLESSSFTVKRDMFGKEMKIQTDDKAKYKIIDDENVIFEQTYELKVSNDTEKGYAVKIKCKFETHFKYHCEVSKDFFELYKDINLSLNTWPYFREYVATHISKANLPPLTLPLLRK